MGSQPPHVRLYVNLRYTAVYGKGVTIGLSAGVADSQNRVF